MARHESDREDLMRDATALVERIELLIDGFEHSVIAGFRRDHSLSVYFGPDPCYHFDTDGCLRRAFRDGNLYRTQGDTIAKLVRSRNGDRVELQRQDLGAEDLEAFLDTCSEELARLKSQIDSGKTSVVQQIPEDGKVLQRLADTLTVIMEGGLRLAPPIAGRR